MTPKISVVMPFYNGEKFLKEAIESILNQTFSDFELILINDGSSDRSLEIVNSFSDPRITVLDNHSNWGLSRSFNRGIQAAKGKYIARMDADDISLPERFQKQLGFLQSHAEIGVVGTNAILIDSLGKVMGHARKPESHLEIKWQSLFSTPIIHPTVIGRREIFEKNPYDEKLYNSEDYELWSRLLFQGVCQLGNIQEPLLKYRVYPHSFTQSLNPDKKATSVKNTITNIESYTALSQNEKEALLDRPGTLKQMIILFFLYRRAALAFEKTEGFKPNLNRYFFALAREFFVSTLR